MRYLNPNTFEYLVYKTVGFSDEKVKKITENVSKSINDEGYIVGIDASNISPESYEKIFEDEISDKFTSDSKIKGKPQFAYIKLGATGYGLNPDLPIVIDIEAKQDGRTYGKDVTEAQIELMKIMKKEFGTAIIYTSGQWFLGNEKILDLERDVDGVGDVNIWLVNPSEDKLSDKARNIYESRLSEAKK